MLASALICGLLALVGTPAVVGALETHGVAGRSRALVVATIARTARAGGEVSIAVEDRVTTGNLPLTICATPPGATTACKQLSLPPGQNRRVVHIAVPRPGGWRFAVSSKLGYSTSTTVWVSPPGGSIRVLAAGDSEMMMLDQYLAADLAPHRVNVTNDARLGTGLTLTYAFHWETHARQEAAAVRPDATVMFIGANDAYLVYGAGGRQIYCCGSAWSVGYAKLVAQMMRSYMRGNAGRVYWFVLPTPRPPREKYLFDGVNAGIRLAAKEFPGRVALIDTNAFFTPHDQYRNYMTYHGHGFTIHQPDGIHLTSVSDLYAAALVVNQMLADRVIK
jgi:hypothetical protein